MKIKNSLYKLKIFFLLVFVATLGYEYWDPIGIRSSFTVTRFFGLLYALFAITDFRNNFRITKNNKALVLSGLFLWLWIMLITVFKSVVYHVEPSLVFSLLQVVVLFWLVYNDVERRPKLKLGLFLAFVVGVFSISILLTLGIGLEASGGLEVDSIDATRIYFMGMNPNGMGALASLAVLLLFYLVFSGKIWGKKTYFLLALTPNLLLLIGASGSRGAFFMVLLGLAVYFGLKKASAFIKVFYLIFGVVAIFFILDYLGDFEKLQSRLTSTYETRDTGNRFELWQAALGILAENPLFGVGFNGLSIEMARNSSNTTAHNVFIDFALMGGIIAFMLFINIIRILLKRSWSFLQLNRDAGNLMILVVILFNLAKSGGGFDSKFSWLMLAATAPVYLIKSKNKL